MNNYRIAKISGLRAAAIGLFVSIGFAGFFYPKSVSGTDNLQPSVQPTPKPRVGKSSRPAKYSQFPHDIKAHGAACTTCHKFPSENWKKVRTGDAAFPDITDYPKHQSCLNCHRQQFYRSATPIICGICHVNPSPRNNVRHAFPNPREIFDTTNKGKTAASDFAVAFPHDKHIEIVSSKESEKVRFERAAWSGPETLARAEESCLVCHQTYKPQGEADDEFFTKPPDKLGDAFWIKKGTFKTAPIGHTNCFSCHSAESGMSPAPTDCATCHKLKMPSPPTDFDPKAAATMGVSDKVMVDLWRRRTSAGKFRHEWVSHSELSCSTCHNVMTMNTADPATTTVSITTCTTCHATPTSDEGGALNYEIDARKANADFQCAKCHITFGRSPIPKSHTAAMSVKPGQ